VPNQLGNFNICKVSHAEAKEFVEKWHYSSRMPTGKNVSFGLFSGQDMYAAVTYGVGVNPYQAKFLGCKKVFEIKRMCRSEPKLSFPLSRFLSITTKWLKKEHKFDMLVAFADPEQGHEGTVYAASGFSYHGLTNAEWHLVDTNGNVRHRRLAYRYAKRHGISTSDARAVLNMTRVRTAPKRRWIRPIF